MGGAGLVWALRRASRMSAPEIAFRLLEQSRRAGDRRRTYGWSDFELEGPVQGLRSLQAHEAFGALGPIAAEESAAVLRGELALLNRVWPRRKGWWAGDLWRIDPETGEPWPGFDRFAFDAPYRGGGVGEVKFLWELNRLPMLPAVAMQAAASGETGAVFAILRGWMEANPPFKGVNWASGVEAAHRLASVLAALAFVQPEAAADRAAVGRFLAAHAFWIARYPSRFSSANNHRVAELSALFLCGLAAPALAPGVRVAALQRALEEEIGRQFHGDGVGSEQSPTYAALSLEWFTLIGCEAEATGRPFSEAFRRRAGLAAGALEWLLDQDGRAPRIGDADDSRVLPLGLAPEPRYIASVVAMTRRWLNGPQPARRDPALRDLVAPPTLAAEPPTGRRCFPDGGLTVWRCPRDDGELMLVLDHGPLGQGRIAAHGHADALSLWLHWGGEAVFVDAGSPLYHGGGALRDALRGADAHNTLTVEGADQSRIIGPFAWSRHAEAKLLASGETWVEAAHDGYRRFGVRHRRRVTVSPETILIEDWLDGPRARAFSLGFTLGPGVRAAMSGSAARLTIGSARRLDLEAEQPWTLKQVAYSPAFGLVQPTWRLALSGRGRGLVSRVRVALHQQSPT